MGKRTLRCGRKGQETDQHFGREDGELNARDALDGCRRELKAIVCRHDDRLRDSVSVQGDMRACEYRLWATTDAMPHTTKAKRTIDRRKRD